MRFLLTTKGGDMAPLDEKVFAEMAAFVEEMTQAGVLLATGGLDPAGTHFLSLRRQCHRDRRAVHRGEGGDCQLRAHRGALEGGGRRAVQALLEDHRRW